MKNLCLVADRHQGFLQRANLLLHPLRSLETKLDELLLALIKDLGFGLPLLLQFLCNSPNSIPDSVQLQTIVHSFPSTHDVQLQSLLFNYMPGLTSNTSICHFIQIYRGIKTYLDGVIMVPANLGRETAQQTELMPWLQPQHPEITQQNRVTNT